MLKFQSFLFFFFSNAINFLLVAFSLETSIKILVENDSVTVEAVTSICQPGFVSSRTDIKGGWLVTSAVSWIFFISFSIGSISRHTIAKWIFGVIREPKTTLDRSRLFRVSHVNARRHGHIFPRCACSLKAIIHWQRSTIYPRIVTLLQATCSVFTSINNVLLP